MQECIPPNRILAVVRPLWLGGLGLILLCAAGAGRALGGDEPMKISVADLEKATKPPEQKRLAVTDGFLFWPELFSLPGKDGKPGLQFVPLVSKQVLDQWLAEEKKYGPKAKFSYNNVRVVVKMSSEQLKSIEPRLLNGMPLDKLYKGVTVTGTQLEYKALPPITQTIFKNKATPQHVGDLLFLEMESPPAK
jgi:hypothetical protein